MLLLKSKSTPIDAYEQLLSTPRSGLALEPIFIPVLEHAFERENILRTDKLLRDRKIGSHEEALYGGLIFTSQRAVEALSQIIKDDRGLSVMRSLLAFSFIWAHSAMETAP